VSSTVDNGVAIVTIHSMAAGGGRAKAIEDAMAAARGARGLVLDLRGDHGGIDRVGARVVAGLAEGDAPLGSFRVLAAPATIALRPQWRDLAVGADGWTAPKQVTTKAQPAGQGFHGPIAVVIDAGCVSTCEVVAAALRADLHATLVGETTGGSSGAPVEVTLPASRGSVQIPTWDLTSAEGKAIESDGVVPDEQVSMTPDTLAAGQDAPLARAIAIVRAKLTP
jgi:C-terminal processing protease CtpA/Prc